MKSRVKRLRARTIIPDELYVDRDADRQLDDVIEEMGRPAYILVARQMGKTNLLLRMKRSREARGELAVYVDLSIGFGDARGLFRHLVDNLLEAHSLDQLRYDIEQERIAELPDPSVEYDRHLRRILRAADKERVILILDEIDSLVGQPYSDRILSQVRSMYFARANFPIYERLTYVLSGVAEPTDLIKDKNISPFNIGEKIYLNDFSRNEVSVLLYNAELDFSSKVQDAVYDWTSGNPRMIWDVYSALEDAQLTSEEVEVGDVDAAIQKLYLTRYDRAPLDHVRALAENDTEVRAALVSLLYGKGDTLDDRSRSKLYLAGITTASANSAPKIKNRVIEHALSETWLAQVEAGRKGLITAAGNRYSNESYVEAIDLFQQFLNAGGSIETLADLEILQYGMALYHVGNYDEAITILGRASKQSRSSEVRSSLNYYIGLSTMLVGKLEEAIVILKGLSETSVSFRLRAQHALSTAYLKTSIEQNADKIIDIIEKVLVQTPLDNALAEDDKAEIISAAHYNVGQVYSAQGHNAQAKAAFEAASDAATSAMKPAFASVRLCAAESSAERERILLEVSDILIQHNIPYSTSRGMLGFDRGDMAELIAAAISLDREDILKQLLIVANSKSNTGPFATIVSLVTSSDWQGNTPQARTLLRYALTNESVVSDALLQQKLNAATIWLAHSSDSDRQDAFNIYWSLVIEPESLEFLSANDTVALVNQVTTYLRSGQIELAKPIVKFVRTNEATLAAASSAMFAFFVYHEMIIHKMERNYDKSLRSAREVLSLISREKARDDPNTMRHSALVEQLRLAASKEISTSAPAPTKIGRNQIIDVVDIKTGKRIQAKFKKVIDKIEAGEMMLASDADLAPNVAISNVLSTTSLNWRGTSRKTH